MNGASPHAGATERLDSWTMAGLLTAAVVLVLFRLHAFDLPLETDEANYAYIGGRLLAGDRLYVDVWDHQPFGVFTLFAAAQFIFGDKPETYRWMASGFSLVSLGFVFLLLRSWAGTRWAILGAILFGLVSSDPGTAGEGCNREIYMNTFILAGWWWADRYRRSDRIRDVFPAGLMLALGSVLKTIVAVHWFLLAIWMAWRAWRSGGGRRWKDTGRVILAFGAAPLLIWAGTALYFLATGRGREFFDAVFVFNLGYSGGSGPFWDRFVSFFTPRRHPFIFESARPLWWMGTVMTVWLAVRGIRQRRADDGLVVLLIASGYLSAALPAHYWPHYYYLLIPGMVLATVTGLRAVGKWSAAFLETGSDRIWGDEHDRIRRVARAEARGSGEASDDRRNDDAPGRATNHEQHRPHGETFAEPSDDTRGSFRPAAASRAAGVVAIVVVLAVGWAQMRHYLLQPPFGITVKRYNSRDFWGRAQGENVRRATDPSDTVFVFGSDTSIYYYARRRCASRFTMITALQEGFPGVEERRRLLLKDLERHKPRLICVLFDVPPWPEWKAFLRTYYTEPIGWDYHDRTREPIMFVVTRRDHPIDPDIPVRWDWDRRQVGGWFPGERRR
ncbi:MAG: hypothetical protein D6788_04060 [Planctomycetota bacterium]|nr:MAG: hypothetical protein D6788_04060 [Planctomycetota bacterium]